MTVQNINTECELIRQKNQTKINKNNNRENMKVLDHENKFSDKVMLKNSHLINTKPYIRYLK